MSGAATPGRRGPAGERAGRPAPVDGAARHLRLVAGQAAAPGPVPLRSRLGLPSTRTRLVAVVTALCAVGTVMVLSASAYTSLVDYGSVWSIFLRQMLWMALAVGALTVCSRVPYQRWRRFTTVLLLGTVVLLLAVLVPGLGDSAGGASRWIGFGQVRVQPSELMKLAIALFAADLLARRSDRLERTGAVVVPLVVVLGFTSLLVLLQPDLGTAVVLACVAFGCLFAAGVPARTVTAWIGGSSALAAAAALAVPYRRARLLSFINPMAHRLTSGYQVVQSLVGISSGRLFGMGLGNGHTKWGLLPNPHTDFIFSVIGEETGLVGAVLVIALFAALAMLGFRVASRAPDRYGALLATAITCWLTAEAVINVGAVIGVLPVTGIPLPFVSFGGSSLIVVMAGTGILLNIAATERQPPGAGTLGARRVRP